MPPRIRYKKGKVDFLTRSHLMPCLFSLVRPELYFLLREHTDHFALTVHLSICGVELRYSHRTNLFVFDVDNLCYLMSSADADDMLNWMSSKGGRVTILMEHMKDFISGLLREISGRYPVYQQLKGERRRYLNTPY